MRILVWGIVLAAGTPAWKTLSSRATVFLALSGLATGLSWLCYFRALHIDEASSVAPVDKLSVVFAVALAAIFLGERLVWQHWTGGALIEAGRLEVTEGFVQVSADAEVILHAGTSLGVTGDLQMDGGTFTAGSGTQVDVTGAWYILGGTVNVNDTAITAPTVQLDGTMNVLGNSTLYGSMDNYGVLNLGGYTLAITGDYAQWVGATVQISPSSPSSPSVSGEADLAGVLDLIVYGQRTGALTVNVPPTGLVAEPMYDGNSLDLRFV